MRELLDLFFKSKIEDTRLEVLTACLYPTSSPKRYPRQQNETPTTCEGSANVVLLPPQIPSVVLRPSRVLDSGASPDEIFALLDNDAAAATIAGHAGRYFGFVVGGTVPGALVASWLNSTWDQCCGLNVMSPAGAQLESVALEWVIEVLGLPSGCGGGVVTGCTMANFSAITAARYALLERVGWDVVSKGLYGAPEIKVVVSDEVHASVLKALSLVGFGRDRVHRVPVDGQGRMRSDALPPLDKMTLVCIQAGNVNTGAFDPAAEIYREACLDAQRWLALAFASQDLRRPAPGHSSRLRLRTSYLDQH